MIFNTVDRKARGRQAEIVDPMRWEDALKRQIVDCHDARRYPVVGERNIRRRQSGLPVVCVNELGAPADGTSRRGEQRGNARQQAEAQRIVVPIDAAGILIWTAVTIVER